MNAKEFLADRKAFWEDKIRYEDYTDGIPALYQNPDKWTGPDTDWFDVVLQTATLKVITFLYCPAKVNSVLQPY